MCRKDWQGRRVLMECQSGVFRPDKVVVRPERLRLLSGRD